MKPRVLRPTHSGPQVSKCTIVVLVQELPWAHGIGSWAGVPRITLHSGSLRAVGHSRRPAGLLVSRGLLHSRAPGHRSEQRRHTVILLCSSIVRR